MALRAYLGLIEFRDCSLAVFNCCSQGQWLLYHIRDPSVRMEGSGLSKGHVKRIFDFAGDPRENGSVLQSSARGHGDRDVMLQGRDWVSRPSEMPTTPSLTVLPDLAGVQCSNSMNCRSPRRT